MLLLLKNHKSRIFYSGLLLLLLCSLTYIWGWKTSGVLENTLSWSYPEGYVYTFHSPKYGEWRINKESAYYLTATQGFLGVEEAVLGAGSYEIYRMLYPFLLKIFWFLEPMEAAIVLDILIWFFACLAIWFVGQNLKLSYSACVFAVIFTIFGQGFLQSVGEGMPHVAGYASGYFILFLLSLLKPWESGSSWREDLPIYAFIGMWQLAYGTAFFLLPLAIFATFYRFYQNRCFEWKQGFFLVALALSPYFIIKFCVSLFYSKSSGVESIILERFANRGDGIIEWAKDYLWILFDSFVSLGPIAVIGLIGLLYGAFYKNNLYFKVLFWVCLLQFLGMAVLLLPLAGRGYATFNFYPILCIGAALLMGQLWDSRKQLLRGSIVILSVLLGIYAHGVKFGFRLPHQIFFTGLANINQSWWSYELQFFQ